VSHAQAMLDTHPRATGKTAPLAEALHALEECARSCAICADACLAEEMVAELRRCIRMNLDCADLCATTAAVLGRQTEGDPAVVRATVEACLAACEACAAECERHADMHEHCKVCAEACRRCADACRSVLGSLA
jgi:hypothetical protein